VTEALITNLAKIGALRVVSRTTAMHHKEKAPPLSEIRRELQVEGVVEGTVLENCRKRFSASRMPSPKIPSYAYAGLADLLSTLLRLVARTKKQFVRLRWFLELRHRMNFPRS